ncbi:TIGR01244 family sulfur transferase [Sphingosinicella terrae]|uniref:TIGR01244 family sulfur transferase n=1 Tax=Sphingosinicella terrae TaxID=2172047 RepID=UPI000E0CE908|nr:TIGR01244 family sulfur transferase [Sphingosinicella terrae]
MKLIPLGPAMFVAGQVDPADMPELAAQGITLVINNRPDGEEPGQPSSAAVEEAARSAGLDYRHIPVAGSAAHDQVEAMSEALGEAEGKVLAFCRSGTRSAYLWAMARASQGEAIESIEARASAAGYDLSRMLPARH